MLWGRAYTYMYASYVCACIHCVTIHKNQHKKKMLMQIFQNTKKNVNP